MHMDLREKHQGDEERQDARRHSAQPKANEWSLRAGHEQHSNAAFKLGNWHFTARQMTKAVRWYERAAQAGHVGAQYNLGLIYLKGEDVPWDGLRGLEWLRKAAKAGDVKAWGLLRKIDPALVREG